MAKQGFICHRSKVGVLLALHVPWFVLCVLVEGTCYSLVSFGIHHSTSMSKVFNGQIQTFVVFNFGWSQKRLYYCFNGNFLCWSSYNNINICCIQKQQYKLTFQTKMFIFVKSPYWSYCVKKCPYMNKPPLFLYWLCEEYRYSSLIFLITLTTSYYRYTAVWVSCLWLVDLTLLTLTCWAGGCVRDSSPLAGWTVGRRSCPMCATRGGC